jgi:BlaI family penicillinase repressor
MKKDLNSYILTRQEHRIMKIIWERGETSVKDVYDVLAEKDPKAYSTVLTLMQILEKKGVLSKKPEGRRYIYSPVLSRRQAMVNQVNDLLDKYFDGSSSMLVDNLMKT